MSSSEAAGRAQAFIDNFANASGWLNRSELRDLECCAEVGKDVLRAGIRSLVAVADGSPMMRSTSADGTTIDAKEQQKFQMPMPDQEFSRSGREAHEHLIMNGFYRYVDHAGAVHTRAHVVARASALVDAVRLTGQARLLTQDIIGEADEAEQLVGALASSALPLTSFCAAPRWQDKNRYYT